MSEHEHTHKAPFTDTFLKLYCLYMYGHFETYSCLTAQHAAVNNEFTNKHKMYHLESAKCSMNHWQDSHILWLI